MNRKKRRIVIALLLLIVVIGFPVGSVYRDMRQARLDHALIEAIKAGDDKRALEALDAGASGEARDSGKPVSIQEALVHLLDHFRYPGASSHVSDDEHLSALPLLYQTAFDDAMLLRTPGPRLTLVRALLNHDAKINDRCRDGSSPLIYASFFNNADAVNFLLAQGADMEAKDNGGNTPLMWAGVANTKALLEHGANIEARNRMDRTPLICSVTSNGANILDIGVVRLLLEHGADVSAKDSRGRTAFDYVRNERYNSEIIALLRQYGAK